MYLTMNTRKEVWGERERCDECRKESQGVMPLSDSREQLHGKPGGLLGGSHISKEA